MPKPKPITEAGFDFAPLKFKPIRVIPHALTCYLLLTLRTAASHHDPATQDDSNKNLFNRRKQILPQVSLPTMPAQAELDNFSAAHPAPAEVAAVLQSLSFAEFVACAVIKLFLDCYNNSDGSGLFTGMERYTRLETRANHAATQAHTLRGLWDRLVRGLQVGIHNNRADGQLLALWGLPRSIQALAVEAMKREYRSVVTIARFWHTQDKLQSESYAEKAGVQASSSELITLQFSATDLTAPSGAAIIEVPEVSANSLRHQVVRNPAWVHLRRALGFQATAPGKGELPPSVQAIFENGGNIEAGAKQPANPYMLGKLIREAFPLLDLVGGVTDSFDLGKAKLDVHTWLVCMENAEALTDTPASNLPTARLSAFEMLDDVTETRQASCEGLGQMIRSFETLASGAQVLTRLTLRPDTRTLTQGALVAAVETFRTELANIGGQHARGYGFVDAQWLTSLPESDESRAEYETYLETNRDVLRSEMISGQLGSGSVVLT